MYFHNGEDRLAVRDFMIALSFQFIRSPSDRSIPSPLLHNFTYVRFLLLDGNGVSGSDVALYLSPSGVDGSALAAIATAPAGWSCWYVFFYTVYF